MAKGKFASVCSVEEFILKQENKNPLKKLHERDVRLLDRFLKTKDDDRIMASIINKHLTLLKYFERRKCCKFYQISCRLSDLSHFFIAFIAPFVRNKFVYQTVHGKKSQY